MFGRYAYIPLVQFLNPKIRNMGDKTLLATDDLRDIYELPMHNISLSGERQENYF